jgi:Protein of unknown function (DUF2917)
MPNPQHEITKWLIEVLSEGAKSESLVEGGPNGFTRAAIVFDWISSKKSLALRKATEIQLPARSLLRMDGSHRGVSFLCRSGLCWITQEGDSKDYLLEHKQNFTINQDGVVVVQALADTELLVSPE